MLENTPNNSAKFTTKNWVEMNDDSRKERNNKDKAKDIDVLMSMYNLVKYSDNYSKTYGSLWEYYGEKPGKHIDWLWN